MKTLIRISPVMAMVAMFMGIAATATGQTYQQRLRDYSNSQMEFIFSNFDLTDAQKIQVEELYANGEKEAVRLAEEMKDGEEEHTVQREALYKLAEEHTAGLKKILGDEKFAEYQKMLREQDRLKRQAEGNPRNYSKRQMELIFNNIELTDAQKTQVEEFYKNREKEIESSAKEMRGKDFDEQREAMMKLVKESADGLKKILGDEKYAEYQKLSREEGVRRIMEGRSPGQ
jgi:Spy/CpxP family protein refolding chaperone